MNAKGESDASQQVDLTIRAGRIWCPASRWDGPGVVAVRGDRIVHLDRDFGGTASKQCDFPDGVLMPGLIDLHAHPARGGSVFGVDPDRWALPFGTTTVMSQGDAGAANLERYLQETMLNCCTRVRLAINLSRVGESTEPGCFASLEDADVAACVEAIERFREHVWGVAVNVSHHACGGSDPREVLRRGLQVAEETGLPLLFGLRRPEDWPLEDQLALLRAGDVVTYCFRRQPHCIVSENRVITAVREARQRGVLFDVGHGTASFAFAVAEAAIAGGFLPNTISTDLQRRHLGASPTHDLPLVMSKLMAAGMPQVEVFRAVTQTPAEVLGIVEQVGTLRLGGCADLTVLCADQQPAVLEDFNAQQRTARRWRSVLTVRGGKVVRSSEEQQ